MNNPKQPSPETAHEPRTGGGSGAAPCSAGCRLRRDECGVVSITVGDKTTILSRVQTHELLAFLAASVQVVYAENEIPLNLDLGIF